MERTQPQLDKHGVDGLGSQCSNTQEALRFQGSCTKAIAARMSHVASGWPERHLKHYMEHQASHDVEMRAANCIDLRGDDLDSLRLLLARMQLSCYSTAFSGVDSPGTAFAMLRAECASMTGEDVASMPAPRHLHAVVPELRFSFLACAHACVCV